MQKTEQSQTVRHLAHDLNNILTRILNSVELLKKKIPENDELTPLLASIENGTYLASEIIEDVISETTNKSFSKRKININSLVTDLVNSLSIHLKDRIKFIVKLDPSVQFVQGRYSDFYRIIMNLIVNAAEAIKEKGNITITTQAVSKKSLSKAEPALFDTENFIQIKITDNGAGIDKSVMPYIFDENFTTKSKKKNSGFGLAIVKKIVDINNGIIKVNSEVNKGTEITLYFASVIIKTNEVSSRDKSILIAEDEDIQRQLLTELLESYNFKVTAVANGEEVIDKFVKDPPDLLIIDRQMPDMDGITCIRNIKEMNFNTPIILAAGSQSEVKEGEDVKKIADKVINKPYNFEEMLSIVRELID